MILDSGLLFWATLYFHQRLNLKSTFLYTASIEN